MWGRSAGRGRIGRPVKQPPGHPEVDGRRHASLHLQMDALPPASHLGDAASNQTRGLIHPGTFRTGDRERRDAFSPFLPGLSQTRIEDCDPVNDPAPKHAVQLAAKGLDLWKFRHDGFPNRPRGSGSGSSRTALAAPLILQRLSLMAAPCQAKKCRLKSDLSVLLFQKREQSVL
jgi:hypothetical protein